MTSHRKRSQTEPQYPQFELRGTVAVLGDIVGPVPELRWESPEGAGSPAEGAVRGDSSSGQASKGGGK